jgi:hypothetical protein
VLRPLRENLKKCFLASPQSILCPRSCCTGFCKPLHYRSRIVLNIALLLLEPLTILSRIMRKALRNSKFLQAIVPARRKGGSLSSGGTPTTTRPSTSTPSPYFYDLLA